MARSHSSAPSRAKVATFTLVLPISRTAAAPSIARFLPAACLARPTQSLRQMKHFGERDRDGRAVGIGAHDVLHMIPPAAHDRMIRQRRHPMARAALEIGEQDRGLLVEMDR